jgi:hypothetical protein
MQNRQIAPPDRCFQKEKQQNSSTDKAFQTLLPGNARLCLCLSLPLIADGLPLIAVSRRLACVFIDLVQAVALKM